MYVHLSWSSAHSWILILNHQFKYVFWGIRNSGTKVIILFKRKAALLKGLLRNGRCQSSICQGKITLERTTELCSSTTVPTRVHMSYPHKYKPCIFSRREMEETIPFLSSDCAAYLYLANAMRISTLQIPLQLLGAAKNLAHLPSFK